MQIKLPKIPIDYSKFRKGKPPFDGKYYFLHGIDDGNEAIVRGKYLIPDEIDKGECYFEDAFGNIYDHAVFTHYTPMPEFEVKGGEA